MPPRKKSASRSATPSTAQTGQKSSHSIRESTAAAPLPQPDPAAVQRLIDDAIARAQKNRAANGTATAGDYERTTAVGGGHSQQRQPNVVSRAIHFVFGARSCVFDHSTTAKLTDLTGTFLVTCICIYFVSMGYLSYREFAINK